MQRHARPGALRVLHIAGLAITLKRMACPLHEIAARSGVEFLYGSSPPLEDGDYWYEMDIGRGGVKPFLRPLRLEAFDTVVSDAAADIIHVHTPATAIALAPVIARRYKQHRFVYTAHGGLDEGKSLPVRTAWRLADPTGWRAWAGVAAVNTVLFRRAVTRRPGRTNIRLPFAGFLDANDPGYIAGSDRVGAGGLVLAWIGRIDADKRPQDFLKVLEKLSERGTKCKGIVMGDALQGDRNGSALRATIHSHPLVEYLGWVDDIGPHLAGVDAVVSTSVREGFGLVAIEAARLGVPTIGYLTNGTAESIASVAGTVVRTKSIDDLVRAIGALDLSTSLERQRLAANVRTLARRFSNDSVWAAHEVLYDQVMQGRSHS